MKVLILPINIASDISHKVRALRNLGVDARGLAFGSATVQTHRDIEVIRDPTPYRRVNRLLRIASALKLYKALQWADVVHWLWDLSLPFGIDKQILKYLDKPGVIQWCGSDIRIPEVDFASNPYYRAIFGNGYEYSYESRENSLRNQRDFAEIGFYPLEFLVTEQYIDHNLFPIRFQTRQPIVLADHEPQYPNPAKKRPLIVHSPTAPVAKGTSHVLAAIEYLKSRYEFDFTLVKGMERERALEIMRSCDIFVDQIILGGYGYAAVEAMAFGKPVVCYINPVTGRNYPKELPIVNGNPETISAVLEKLICDGERRADIGRSSRAFAEKYHDDGDIARELVETYTKVIELHKNRPRF